MVEHRRGARRKRGGYATLACNSVNDRGFPAPIRHGHDPRTQADRPDLSQRVDKAGWRDSQAATAEPKVSVARQWRFRLFWEAGLARDVGRGRNGSRGACSYSARRGRSPQRWPAGEISAPASVSLLRAAQGRGRVLTCGGHRPESARASEWQAGPVCQADSGAGTRRVSLSWPNWCPVAQLGFYSFSFLYFLFYFLFLLNVKFEFDSCYEVPL
jgi:hypothetical protein